jgi:hypothetical protein
MEVVTVAPGATVKPELLSAADTSVVGSPPKRALEANEKVLAWQAPLSLFVRLTV